MTLTSSDADYGWDGLFLLFELLLDDQGDSTGTSVSTPLTLSASEYHRNTLVCLEDGNYLTSAKGIRLNPDVGISIRWFMKETGTLSNIPVEIIAGNEDNKARFSYAHGLFLAKVIASTQKGKQSFNYYYVSFPIRIFTLGADFLADKHNATDQYSDICPFT